MGGGGENGECFMLSVIDPAHMVVTSSFFPTFLAIAFTI